MKNDFLVRVLLVAFLQCGVGGVQAGYLDDLRKDLSEVFDEAKQKTLGAVDEAPEVAEEVVDSALDTAKDVIEETKSKGLELLKKFESAATSDDVNRDLYGI